MFFGALGTTLFASRFSPPAEQLPNPARLNVLMLEIRDGNPADAAARVEALLAEGETALIPTEHGLTSLWAWVEALPEDKARAMRAAAPPTLQMSAKRAMDGLLGRDRAEAHEFIQLARRYPLTQHTPEMLAHAARRFAVIGDRGSARAAYARAIAIGFAPVGDEAVLVESLLKSPVAPLPVESPALAVPWTDGRNPYGWRRYIPVTFGGLTIIAGPGHVIAAEPRGTVRWIWNYTDFVMRQTGKAPEGKLSEAVLNRSRQVRYEPAIVDDGAGAIARIIVRQPSIRRTDSFAIRSIDVAGQLAWATDSTDALDHLNFCSTPAVAGRHVYVVAQQRIDRQPEKLLVVALDTMTGALLWQCDLGPLVDRVTSGRERDRESPGEYNDLWADQSSVAVDDDNLYIAPGGGTLIAVDHLGGAVRWHGFYEEFATEVTDKKRISDLRKGANQRFSNSPVVVGQQVILAPRDSAMAVAFDRRTGAMRWRLDAPVGQTLLGATDEIAVLMRGAEMTGVRVTDGTVAWSYRGEGRSRALGPAVLVGEQVVFAVDAGLAALNLKTGQPVSGSPRGVTAMSTLLNAAPVRAALGQAGALDSFLIGKDNPEPDRRNRER